MLLDDAMARRWARYFSTGTLGVLLKAKAGGHLPALCPVVEQLERAGFRLDASTRAAVLRLADE